MTAENKRIYIHDVTLRDGFQIEPNFIATEEKVSLINRLSRTGLAKIETTSFTSPQAIPNLRDAEQVMRQIERVPGVVYAVLVPNLKGCKRALACQVDEINLVMSASQSHNQVNLRMTCEQSLGQFREIAELATRSSIFVNGSISTAFGCPFEGRIPESRVLELIRQLLDTGIQGVTLCDTTGMANPEQVRRLCEAALGRWPEVPFTLHFHNTRGMGLANVVSALGAGLCRFDASLGGVGGCPFVPDATGNICTEDLVHMLEEMGCNTAVELDTLIEIARDLPAIVGHDVPGQIMKAGKADRKYSRPEWIVNPKEPVALADSRTD